MAAGRSLNSLKFTGSRLILIYRIEADFKARVEKEFNKMINQVLITGKV